MSKKKKKMLSKFNSPEICYKYNSNTFSASILLFNKTFNCSKNIINI